MALRFASPVVQGTGAGDVAPTNSAALGLAEIETLANVFRSDQLAWRVILDRRLYADPAFNGGFYAELSPASTRSLPIPLPRPICWSAFRRGCM